MQSTSAAPRRISRGASIPTDPDALLTEGQAAEFLNISVRTLQGWRLRGGGPVYVKCGRAVRYRRRDLRAYVDARIFRHTTDTSAPAEG